jgi:protein gp37
MGATTHITWCDATWNPWRGCIKVSPGCTHCYMYDWHRRYRQDGRTVRRASPATFNAPLSRGWRAPRHVFSASLSDFFLEEADAWRPDAWDVIRRTPQHRYLLLTKRPERIADHLPNGWPWPHVWLGASVETPAYLWRADVLRTIPAAGRFLSCEPLLEDLGPVNLDGISWVIIGGESGPAHRPMAAAWVASLVRQCRSAGAACFVKQGAGRRAGRQGDLPDDLWSVKERP